jgi:hypothetical protein
MKNISEDKIVQMAVDLFGESSSEIAHHVMNAMRDGHRSMGKIIENAPDGHEEEVREAADILFNEVAPNVVHLVMRKEGVQLLPLHHEHVMRNVTANGLREIYSDLLCSDGYDGLRMAMSSLRHKVGHYTAPDLLIISPMNGNLLTILIDRIAPPTWEKTNFDFLSQSISMAAKLRSVKLDTPAWHPDLGLHFINSHNIVTGEIEIQNDELDEMDEEPLLDMQSLS